MTQAGMKFYKLGLQMPTHDHGIPKNPNMPDELKKALAKNKAAGNNFDRFPPSARKMLYRWILHAKLPKTRKKRIGIAVKMARTGKKSFI